MTDPALSDRIRSAFPALRREVDGRPVAFLDGPAGSQVPQPVVDAVAGYLAHHNANTGGAFATSVESDELIETARRRMAAFLGASSPGEVAFGGNMTTLTFALARALRRDWAPGDEVVVTTLDHQANIAPWRAAAEEVGASVREVPFDPVTCELNPGALREAISPRTRLVAIGYASNALGTVNDVAEAARLAHEVGALCFVDAVHYAPHGLIDVRAIGCDLLACSAYKFFGPHVGVLWGRREILDAYRPYKVPPAPDASPERWETGTLNHEGIAGTAAAVEWIASLDADGARGWRARVAGGMRTIESVERPLLARLLDGLARLERVRVYGPAPGRPRTPTVAFTVDGLRPEEVAERLAGEGIFVWAGDFYASTVIDALGLREGGGVVRVGLAPYTTAAEIDRLLEALGRL